MKVEECVYTPRFGTVKIFEIFENEEQARENGYKEPTHYQGKYYKILGRSFGMNRMVFAAVKKGDINESHS